ncbi:hypothetical protein [Sphingobacterium sp. Mn56C]
MDMDKYKRDYRFKSDEGSKGSSLKWLIILCGVAIAAVAYFFK